MLKKCRKYENRKIGLYQVVAKQKAEQQGVNILQASENAYTLAAALSKTL